QDQDVLELVDALDAVAAELRHPEELAQVPRGLGEVGVLEPPTGLQDRDLVALLGQTQRRDAAAEPGPDDDDVVVELAHGDLSQRRTVVRRSTFSSRVRTRA